MSVKVIVGIIIIAIVSIIIGLVVLLQKQPKTSEKAVDENGLEIVGESGVASQNEEVGVPPQEEKTQEIVDTDLPDSTITYSKQPDMTIDKKKEYSAILTTTAGDITIEFTTKETPITVNNFVTLARDNFYNNTIFHRVIAGFMIQGGDPDGIGTGGPGYTIPEEIGLKHVRGAVATARLGDEMNPNKDSSGSQFFIVHKDAPSLDGEYTVFGNVTKGMEVVDAIATAEVTAGRSGEGSTPVNPVKIKNVKIIEK